jgi:hypothetical protein
MKTPTTQAGGDWENIKQDFFERYTPHTFTWVKDDKTKEVTKGWDKDWEEKAEWWLSRVQEFIAHLLSNTLKEYRERVLGAVEKVESFVVNSRELEVDLVVRKGDIKNILEEIQ